MKYCIIFVLDKNTVECKDYFLSACMSLSSKKFALNSEVLSRILGMMKLFQSHYDSFASLYGRGYLPEPFWQIRSYLPEPIRHLKSYLTVPFRHLKSYLPEPQ